MGRTSCEHFNGCVLSNGYLNNQNLGIVNSVGFISDARDLRNELTQIEKKEKMIKQLQKKHSEKKKSEK